MKEKNPYLSVIFLILICMTTLAHTEVGPPDKQNLAGNWVGFDDYAATFYRLELSTNKCIIASTYPKQPLRLYTASNWTLNQGNLEFTADGPEGGIHFQGAAEFNRIKAQISGVTRTWNQEIIFFREERIAPRFQEIRKQMESSQKSSG
jgi:hypothetical protein